MEGSILQRAKKLLSSFVVKNNSSTDDSIKINGNSSPEKVSRPNDVRSRDAFFKRVETFTTFTWFAKPTSVSPLTCARYGWENTEVDLLRCVTCKAALSGKLPKKDDYPLYLENVKLLEKALISNHKELCSWQHNPSPETFLDLDLDDKDIAVTEFCDRVNDLLMNIQQWCAVEYSFLGEKADEIIDGLCDIVNNRKRYTIRIESPEKRQKTEVACLLALCGWTSEKKSSLVECKFCKRKVGIWNFAEIGSVRVHCDQNEADDGVPVKKKQKTANPFDPILQHKSWCSWITSKALPPVMTENLHNFNDSSSPSKDSMQNDNSSPSKENVQNDNSSPSKEGVQNDNSSPSKEGVQNDNSSPLKESVQNDKDGVKNDNSSPSKESVQNDKESVKNGNSSPSKESVKSDNSSPSKESEKNDKFSPLKESVQNVNNPSSPESNATASKKSSVCGSPKSTESQYVSCNEIQSNPASEIGTDEMATCQNSPQYSSVEEIEEENSVMDVSRESQDSLISEESNENTPVNENSTSVSNSTANEQSEMDSDSQEESIMDVDSEIPEVRSESESPEKHSIMISDSDSPQKGYDSESPEKLSERGVKRPFSDENESEDDYESNISEEDESKSRRSLFKHSKSENDNSSDESEDEGYEIVPQTVITPESTPVKKMPLDKQKSTQNDSILSSDTDIFSPEKDKLTSRQIQNNNSQSPERAANKSNECVSESVTPDPVPNLDSASKDTPQKLSPTKNVLKSSPFKDAKSLLTDRPSCGWQKLLNLLLPTLCPGYQRASERVFGNILKTPPHQGLIKFRSLMKDFSQPS